MKYLIILTIAIFSTALLSVDYLAIPMNDIIAGSHQLSADGTKFEQITTASTTSAPNAKILYSDYQATLADSSEIDSGWLDMATVDKVQFSGNGSAVGMTMTIESRADDAQAALITPVTSIGTFYMFNVIARQRYMRFLWSNNTGSGVTGVSMEIKASYGSSDKMSVFPVNVDPSNFSQASLVQSIVRGQTPNGLYVNQQINEAGASLVSSFGTEVARGLYSGYRVKNKFGHNDDIDTGSGPEDVIHGGGTYTGFNAIVNENIEVFSASAADSGNLLSSGTATGGSATTLIDTGATFVTDTVAIGDVILNDTMGFHGFVTAVDSETQLTVYRMNDGAGFVHVNSTGDTYRVAESTSTGAAVVKLNGLLNSNDEELVPRYVILNGTTGVIATGDYFRCPRSNVIHSGSSGLNAGEITIRQETTTVNVFALMDTIGQSEVMADTVPKGKTAIIKDVRASIVRSNGSAGSGHVVLFSREKGGSWNAREVFAIQTGANIDQRFTGGIVLESGTDFKMTITDVSDNNTEADASLEYFFIDEESL